MGKSQEGIAEAVVVALGEDTARGQICSILLVAEAVQEMTSTVKKSKLTLNIVGARAMRIEYANLELLFLGGGETRLALTGR